MKQQGVTRPLLPAGQPLDLFVTVTDFHGHREKLRLNSPSDVSETEHRITIGFSTRGQDPGHLAPPAELVFAARATASFPGAFPPFNVRELDGLLLARSIAWNGRDAFLKRILPQQFEAGTIEDSFLIDGSVLANAPFAQAIGALRNRPARREVDRRFVYIDPKPGLPSFRVRGRNRAADGPRKAPGFFATIFGASSDIPREQPIRDSLNAIEMRSERIARMREITDHLEVEVEHMIETMLGKTWFLTKPTPQRLHKWRLTMLEKSALATGYSYPAYAHLRMTGLLDEIVATARRVCPDAPTDHCHQLRAALWGEICRRGLDRITGPKGKVMAAASMRFFREQDVRFRIRRLRFIARKLAEDVEVLADVPVAVADRLRQAIYASLAHFLEVETAEYLGVDVAEAVRHGVENPGALLDMLAARRNLEAADAATDAALNAALANVPDAATRSILMGYLGYILYDIATLPLLQGEGLDEFDPIKVDRISPDDATTIRKGGAAATLKGIEFNNFGAFFSRSYRENDYLWGRLHGIDRLVDIVLSSMPGTLSAEQAEVLALKKKAFEAVLEAEAPRLKRIQPLIEELRAEIAAIKPV